MDLKRYELLLVLVAEVDIVAIVAVVSLLTRKQLNGIQLDVPQSRLINILFNRSLLCNMLHSGSTY